MSFQYQSCRSFDVLLRCKPGLSVVAVERVLRLPRERWGYIRPLAKCHSCPYVPTVVGELIEGQAGSIHVSCLASRSSCRLQAILFGPIHCQFRLQAILQFLLV
jgi:hypothetical protein